MYCNLCALVVYSAVEKLLDRFNSCVLLMNAREPVCPGSQGCLEACENYIYMPIFFIQYLFNRLRGRVVKVVGHLDHV